MRKKIIIRQFSGVLVCLGLVLSFSLGAFAYTFIAPNSLWKFSGGSFNKKYLLYCTDTLGSSFTEGFTRWNNGRRNGSAVCSFSSTSSISGSNVDCYASALNNYSILGQTDYFSFNGNLYSYTEIDLNTTALTTSTTARSQATATHEIGHALGLGENNNMPATIMCQESGGRSVTTPQADDLNGVYALYN